MKGLLLVLVLLAVGLAALGTMMTVMPGNRMVGPPPALNELESELEENLRAHVETLALDIGPRGQHKPEKLADAGDYIENRLSRAGLDVQQQPYVARGRPSTNLVAEMRGTRKPEDVIVVGAHYDSAQHSPGGNDNASGVAALIEVAVALADGGLDRTVRFVFFSNGAEPYAGTPATGSRAYAQRCVEAKDKLLVVLVLDSIGAYSDKPKSQHYPFPLSFRYPDKANFVAILGDMGSYNLVSMCTEMYRASARHPCEGGLLPNWYPGVSVSDDASFRAEGFPAVRVTDTGTMRHKETGTMSDTHDRLDYARMARVTADLIRLVGNLAQRRTDLH